MASRPNALASAANSMSSANAALTRICAVVLCSVISARDSRPDRSRRRTAATRAATRARNEMSRASCDAVPLLCSENSSDSRTIGTTSAMEPAATMTWPKAVSASPASSSTGTMTPRLVAERMTAMRSGERTRPPAPRTTPVPSASAKDTANARSVATRNAPTRMPRSHHQREDLRARGPTAHSRAAELMARCR